jgi:hypothetical protein
VHGSPGRTINVVPEAFDQRMRCTPFSFELFNFGVGELLGLKFPPSVQAALISSVVGILRLPSGQ